MRDRLLKFHEQQHEKNLKIRNTKILQTVDEHFPDIDIISQREKHKKTIEQLAKPRRSNTNKKF